MQIRPEVLALVDEAPIDPERPIVDAHHHVFETTEGFPVYRLEDLRADTASHAVRWTVYVQCGEHYRDRGPSPLRVVGETEWVDRLAREPAPDPRASRIVAIVGAAELILGEGVAEVLEAHLAASRLFRGVRDVAIWDEDPAVHSGSPTGDAGLYDDPRFRRGFARLRGLDLSYDSYHYHTQTPSLTRLARAFPDTRIVVDHLATPIGVGRHAGRRKEIFEVWRRDLVELATCPNVYMKLGGLLMPWNGFGWDEAARPPTSDELVAVQGPYYRHAIETFGPSRCLFESNFPVDKVSVSYGVLWNAFKKLAAPYSEDEQDRLFRGTASEVYRLDTRLEATPAPALERSGTR